MIGKLFRRRFGITLRTWLVWKLVGDQWVLVDRVTYENYVFAAEEAYWQGVGGEDSPRISIPQTPEDPVSEAFWEILRETARDLAEMRRRLQRVHTVRQARSGGQS